MNILKSQHEQSSDAGVVETRSHGQEHKEVEAELQNI